MSLSFGKPNGRHFQVMSDLHLEVGQQYKNFHVQPCAPYLILAGDIGRLADYDAFRDFLATQCGQFKHILLVLGNHEFFATTHSHGLLQAEKLENEASMEGRLSVMDRKRVDMAGIIVLGCTLQSHIPDDSKAIVAQKINDFRHIAEWTVADHNAEHIKDVAWLKNEIQAIRQAEETSQRKILVVTHHAPLIKGTSSPGNENNPWSSAFSIDLLGQHEGSPLDEVDTWGFGHTHHCSEIYGREVSAGK